MPEIKLEEQYELFNFRAQLITVLGRIADSHERMVMIAMEAREERLKLADAMKERMKAGFSAEK